MGVAEANAPQLTMIFRMAEAEVLTICTRNLEIPGWPGTICWVMEISPGKQLAAGSLITAGGVVNSVGSWWSSTSTRSLIAHVLVAKVAATRHSQSARAVTEMEEEAIAGERCWKIELLHMKLKRLDAVSAKLIEHLNIQWA
jgi:hypothetical protein